MEYRTVIVEVDSYSDVITLVPIFDTHLGNAYCAKEKLIRDLAKTKGEKTFYLLGGDIFDCITVQDKRYHKEVDDIEGRGILNKQKNLGVSIFRPYASKIWGAIDGNHEDVIADRGYDITEEFCDDLGISYLGTSAIIRLVMRQMGGSTGHKKTRTVAIRLHHGWGGASRTPGGDLTKYARAVANYDCDIYLYGHCHKRTSIPFPIITMSGNTLIEKDRRLCLCGTYQKTLEINTGKAGPYSEKKDFSLTGLGHLTITIKMQKRGIKLSVKD